MKYLPVVLLALTNLSGLGELSNLDDPRTLRMVIKEARPSEKTYSGNVFDETYVKIPYTGWVKDTYFNGRICRLYYLNADSNREGLAVSWYEDGSKSREAHYKDGKKHGLETIWDDRGQKVTETHYQDDWKSGPYIKWRSGEIKEEEGNHRYGKRHGLWTNWDEDGEKILENHYEGDVKHGRETKWKNGLKWHETHYQDGKEHGIRTYWEEGERFLDTEFQGGKKHGLEILWGDAGQKWRETRYQGGKVHGLETRWYPGAGKREEGDYQNDMRNGLWKEWDQQGKISEVRYINGERKSQAQIGQLKAELHNKICNKSSKVYFGNYGSQRAIYGIQWMGDNTLRGSVYLYEKGREIFLYGTNYVQGQLQCELWEAGKLVGGATISKTASGGAVNWGGEMSDGSRTRLRFSRNADARSSGGFKSSYVGRVGSSDIDVVLEWKKDATVSGSYQSRASGRRYRLEGDNTVDGFLYLDEFTNDNLSARVLLGKQRLRNGSLAWVGTMFNTDGRRKEMRFIKSK